MKTVDRKHAGTTLLLSLATAMTTGCGITATNTTAAPVALAGPQLHGTAFGGQQPIAGGTLHLYAASTTGYAATNTDLLNSPVQTNSGGYFNITGDYSCTAGQQMYLVVIGGNTGGGLNPQVGVMAALGDCANLSASTEINVNEVTTVGSVFALAPFMASYSALGTSPNNTSGLKHAFASVNKLVNIASGQAGGSALPAGASVPAAEINTLADIIAACVNSTGGAYNDGSICGTLFSYVASSAATAPTDTIGLALAIAKSPALNATPLFNAMPPGSPFVPQLATAPSDFTIAVTYTAGSFNAPKSTTIDAAGNVWVANAGNNTVSLLTQTGVPVTGSPYHGNGLSAPAAVAIDVGGNAWIANKGGSAVSVFTPAGAAFGASPFAGSGTINAPSSTAMDASGNVWIANSGSSSVTELSSAGTYVQQVSTEINAPASLAINPK